MDDIQTTPLVQADGRAVTEGYMPGFGNDFETEALPGALPRGMNSQWNKGGIQYAPPVR